MDYSSDIFKAYDIRGVYPTQLNETAAFDIGSALAELIGGKKVVVGRDMRLSSLSLHQALINGLRSGGCDVSDLDLVPIDAIYFAVGKYEFAAGVMVTASHNPAEYNGFKIMRAHTQWVRGTEIASLIKGQAGSAKKTPGHLSELDIWPDYIKHVLSFIKPSLIKPLRVVVDAGNGMAGKAIPLLFKNLSIELVPQFFELDGSFPNRPSNPLAVGAAEAISSKVREVKADLGIMFDGDSDRVFFIDERGTFVPADVTLLLLAQEFLQNEPGCAIAYNLICSKAVPEFIKQWGGRPIRTAVGYVNVSQALLKQGAVMGGELSAHYSFKDNFCADSGMIAALIVLETISRLGKPLSKLVEQYFPYAKAPEVNLAVADKQKILSELKKHYQDAKQDELDGITIEYEDWWANIRPSNTEPLLRITVEANNKALLSQKQSELVNFVKSL